MTYDEALELRKKLVNGATAEQLGFQAALRDEHPRQMSADPYLQGCYEQGFHDGKAILAQTKQEA